MLLIVLAGLLFSMPEELRFPSQFIVVLSLWQPQLSRQKFFFKKGVLRPYTPVCLFSIWVRVYFFIQTLCPTMELFDSFFVVFARFLNNTTNGTARSIARDNGSLGHTYFARDGPEIYNIVSSRRRHYLARSRDHPILG